MIPGLSTRLLTRLIEIGRNEAFDEFHQLFADFPEAGSRQLMRYRHPEKWFEVARRRSRPFIRPFEEWYKVAQRRSLDEITALIKALTVWERDWPNVGWGSTSPVIPLYRYLPQVCSQSLREFELPDQAYRRLTYLKSN